MTLLRALNGALLASLRPVASGIIADVTSEQRRGKVYGVVQFCTNLGLMAGALIGTPLSTRSVLGWQGWRVAFIGIGLALGARGALRGLHDDGAGAGDVGHGLEGPRRVEAEDCL